MVTLCFFALNSSFSQKRMVYAGEYYSDQIDVVDTTGLAFTIISSMTATSNFGPVTGIYGLALHPITNVMYVCYQSSGAANRRLGTINTTTGVIADIGNCGNIVDMDFGPTGTLYGSTGNFSGFKHETNRLALKNINKKLQEKIPGVNNYIKTFFNKIPTF